MSKSSLPQFAGVEQDASRQPKPCAGCGVSSHERPLLGTKNVRRRDQPMWCLRCHPRFAGGDAALRWMVLA